MMNGRDLPLTNHYSMVILITPDGDGDEPCTRESLECSQVMLLDRSGMQTPLMASLVRHRYLHTLSCVSNRNLDHL